jgi:putative heme-binding domain-containing protein
MARKALRDQLLAPGALAAAVAGAPAPADLVRFAGVCLGIADAAAAGFLLDHLDLPGLDAGQGAARLHHIVRNLPPERLGEVVAKVQARFAGDPAAALAFLRTLRDTRAERGLPADPATTAWADALFGKILGAATDHTPWPRAAIAGLPASADPWEVETRASADGVSAPFLSSRQRGETLTGSVRSAAFAAPARLSFWLAGHNGPPGSADAGLNVVHLLDAQSGAVLMQAVPPRQDVATEVVWDLTASAGKQVVLEIVDAQRGDGYAWLALGRLSAPAPTLPGGDPVLVKAAAELAKALRLPGAAAGLARVAADPSFDPPTRAAAVAALIAVDGAGHRAELAGVLADEHQAQPVREAIIDGLAGLNDGDANATLVGALTATSYRIQLRIASAIAGTASGSTALLASVAAGKLSPRVLRERLVADRLTGADPANTARIAELTRGLPPAGADRDQLIQERLRQFRAGTPSAEEGRKVFVATCTACHRIAGQGGTIGPQLDGIGQRGPERLLEDILDPSRNVDQAFRQSTLTLADGRVLYGIIRRTEGQSLVLADMAGIETTIASKDVVSRTQSLTSLMPDAFGQIVPADRLGDLVAYLVTQQGK